MKKLLSTLFAFAVIASMTVIASCGGSSAPSNENVKAAIGKYDKGDNLTESDWSAVIGYVDAAMDDMLPIYKEINEAQSSGDYSKLESIQGKAEKLNEKYKYLFEAIAIMENCDDNVEIGKANEEKAEKLLKKMGDAGVL